MNRAKYISIQQRENWLRQPTRSLNHRFFPRSRQDVTSAWHMNNPARASPPLLGKLNPILAKPGQGTGQIMQVDMAAGQEGCVGHCHLSAQQPAHVLSQAAVMELNLWRWPPWVACPPSPHCSAPAVLVEDRSGLDGNKNLLSPSSPHQIL